MAENANAQLQVEITDHQKTAQTLATTARELAEKARLLDLSNDAIIVRGFDDKISVWNRGAEKLYGWACEEVIDKDLHLLLRTQFPKPREEIVAQLYREGQFTGEVLQFTRDGRPVPSLCRWVLDVQTKSILTSYTAITERRALEEVGARILIVDDSGVRRCSKSAITGTTPQDRYIGIEDDPWGNLAGPHIRAGTPRYSEYHKL